jgi:nitroreductase/NAD-dependent dihydropyrimidine dehydrogenase PreA subunit
MKKHMAGLIVDQGNCRKDGLCARVCPVDIIKLDVNSGFPEIPADGKQACLACGHCVAVCPQGALSHNLVPFDDCPEIDSNLVINDKQAIQFLRSRRSTRFFIGKTPSKETLKKIVEVARYAPTARNTQLVEWVILTDRNEIREISETTVNWMRATLADQNRSGIVSSYIPGIVKAWDMGVDILLRDTPVLVVASAPKKGNHGMVDVTLALSYFELAAQTKGLGTCWAGLLKGALLSSSTLREKLGIPRSHPHYFPMMIGYPKSKYYRLPERKIAAITWK